MRFLHTADWHVGRTIRGRSRAEEHRAVLAEVAAVAAARQVDAVLVCGDVFDSAAPTPESEQIVYRALLDLAATGATVVVLAGNHDSDRRLQAVAPVLDLGRVVVRPTFLPAADGGVVEVDARDGSGERMRVACVPFLSQRYVVRADELMAGEAHQASMTYEQRYRRLVAGLTDRLQPDTVNVVAAHAMVDGATMAGSERLAHTVFAYGVPSTAFPAHCHYVALGHLHRPQVVAGPCPVRYSGSPLQLDFGEAGEAKSVVVVEAHPGTPAAAEVVDLHAGRALAVVRGTVEHLRGLAGTTGDAHLRVHVLEPTRVGLADEVRELFPDAVDVVVEPPEATGSGAVRASRSGRSPSALFGDYLAERGVDDPRLGALFAELLEEVSEPSSTPGSGA